MSDIRVRVGKRVRELRHQKGLKQDTMSKQVGIHRSYLCDVECGKRNISIENLEKLWVFFEMTPEEFFRGV